MCPKSLPSKPTPRSVPPEKEKNKDEDLIWVMEYLEEVDKKATIGTSTRVCDWIFDRHKLQVYIHELFQYPRSVAYSIKLITTLTLILNEKAFLFWLFLVWALCERRHRQI